SIRLVEEQGPAANAGAKQRALDDGGCDAGGRGRRQRQRLGVVVARHACREGERLALAALLGRLVLDGWRRIRVAPELGEARRRNARRARRRQVRERRGTRGLEVVMCGQRFGERRAHLPRRARAVGRESLGFAARGTQRAGARGLVVGVAREHFSLGPFERRGRCVVGPWQRRAALDAAEAGRVRAGLVVAVEERAERVVVGLRDRIVLVVVAARAADREPQERDAERVVRSLDHVLGLVLGVDRAVLGRALAHAQVRRREDLLARRIRQQVAGELP